MPWDFTEIIKPVAKKDAFCADHDMPINMEEKNMCIIGRDKILNLKKKQLETLHNSDEYKEFNACMQRWKAASQAELTESQRKMERGKLQEAFDYYIQRIRRELNPKRHYTDKCLTIMRNYSDVLGEGLLLLTYIHFLPLAGVNGAKCLKNKEKSAISRAIEMLPGKIVEAAESIMLPKESFPVAIAPLAKDFPLYFKRNKNWS